MQYALVMGLMNLLKADFTQSVGKVTGARWKGVSVVKSKIEYKAAPTATQTHALRRYEIYLRLVAAVYAQVKASKRFLPPNMSLFNWAASKSKDTLNSGGELAGKINIHAPIKDVLEVRSATYAEDTSILTMIWPTSSSIEQYPLVEAVVTLHDVAGYKLGTAEAAIRLDAGRLDIQFDTRLKNPAYTSFVLFGADRKLVYCNGYARPVTVNLGLQRAAPKRRAAAVSLDLPNLELGDNILEGRKDGKDEPVKGKLGRQSRPNRRRKVEKPVDD
jgi:hypothetical protein